MKYAYKSYMLQLIEGIKTNKIVTVLGICCPLILCLILCPSFRYEKASIGKMEIMYDRFKEVIYLKNSLNPNDKWIPTEHKNIMEAKYRLAEKELEEAIEEIRQGTRQKPKNKAGLHKIIMIPASP